MITEHLVMAFSCISAFKLSAGTRVLLNYTVYIFIGILNFLLTYSSLKILTAVLGKVFVLINIYLIPEHLSECDQRIVTYRRTLEGLKNFTSYLEPSVCWNIYC